MATGCAWSGFERYLQRYRNGEARGLTEYPHMKREIWQVYLASNTDSHKHIRTKSYCEASKMTVAETLILKDSSGRSPNC